MTLREIFLRTACAAALAILLVSAGFADTIRLKDGSLIKGTIVSFKGGKFVVAIGDGPRRRELSFYADEIESIQFDSAEQTTAYRTTSPGSSTRGIPDTSGTPAKTHKVVLSDNTIPVQTSSQRSSDPGVFGSSQQSSTTTSEPIQSAPVQTAPSTPPVITTKGTNKPAGAGKPVELNIKVLADNTANGWTNSGWVVRRGQRVRITATGNVSLGKGKSTPPSGLSEMDDSNKLMKSVPTGALIAVIGDDNNDFIYIGQEREFTASRDGSLFLGVNEGNLDDNSGSFEVKVEIFP